MEFTYLQVQKAKACQSIEEFKELAKAEGFDFTDKQAEEYFNAVKTGELSDADLDQVAGGGKKDEKGWNPNGGFSFDATCPDCNLTTHFVYRSYKKESMEKHDVTPAVCRCGARVAPFRESKECSFTKEGSSFMRFVPMRNLQDF